MKITFKKQTKKAKTLKDLKIGDCFRFDEDDDEIFMKTEKSYIGGVDYEAVSLKNGQLYEKPWSIWDNKHNPAVYPVTVEAICTEN